MTPTPTAEGPQELICVQISPRDAGYVEGILKEHGSQDVQRRFTEAVDAAMDDAYVEAEARRG